MGRKFHYGDHEVRYIAFLRGVSPLNARNVNIKQAFEAAGFSDVKTVLSSGNIAFCAVSESLGMLAQWAEDAMPNYLSRPFYTIVRPQSALYQLVQADPFAAFNLPAGARRFVTFLGEPANDDLALPIQNGGAYLLSLVEGNVLSAAAPGKPGQRLLRLTERIFGSHVTTRTWETVKKCAFA